VKIILVISIVLLSLSHKKAQSQPYDFVVDQQGMGNFNTVQEAIDAVPYLRKNETSIFIKNGRYKEKLTLPSTRTNVSFVGEDVLRTILTYDD